MMVPQKLKIELLYDLAMSLLSKYPKEEKSGSPRIFCSWQQYSQYPKGGDNSSVHSWRNGSTKCVSSRNTGDLPAAWLSRGVPA
jgi:hypothetical protein